MRTADKARCAVLLLLGAAAVGCAPSSVYDGLSGGTRPGGKESSPSLTSEIAADASLAPPRPISPLSVSIIPSSRPVLTWRNIAGATGATVELARTRTFEGAKTFVLDGEKSELPEELEPGMWFWRLRSRAPGRNGTEPSATWQMYVRGRGKTGSSTAPIGSVLDWDGDGEGDLLLAGDEPVEGTMMPTLYAFRGGGVLAPYEPFERSSFQDCPLGGAVSITGGTDLDGDGFADYAFAGLATLGDPAKPEAEGPRRFAIGIEYGADAAAEDRRSGGITPLENVSTATTVSAAGDFDGDGYGDLLYAEPHNLVLARGSAKGPLNLFPIAQLEAPTLLPVAAGIDVNGDGFTDVVHRLDSSEGKRNLSLVTGGRDLAFGGPTTLVPQIDATHRIRALVSGDFDGDGLSDFALASQRDAGVGSTCIYFGDKGGALRPGNCFSGERGDLEWGIALGAVDLRGEGRDVLLVSAKDASGLRVEAITFDASTVIAEEVARGEGAAIATLLPGHIGQPGRWAATSAELDAVRVHEGYDRIQTLPAPPGAKAFGRALR